MARTKSIAKRRVLQLTSETRATRIVSRQPSNVKKNKNTASDLPRSEASSNVVGEKKVPKGAIMVPHAELEEFFSAVEKKSEEDFAAKYNFDFVNEVPMDGRYEWVKVKPSP